MGETSPPAMSASSLAHRSKPDRANRTPRVPLIRLRSWACMGWPSSSIT
ncbi:Uncharacterised protein [Mycobacterium tuberculosis]|nr:Uncharacterised protein [Mycobacterium tuberculosis]